MRISLVIWPLSLSPIFGTESCPHPCTVSYQKPLSAVSEWNCHLLSCPQTLPGQLIREGPQKSVLASTNRTKPLKVDLHFHHTDLAGLPLLQIPLNAKVTSRYRQSRKGWTNILLNWDILDLNEVIYLSFLDNNKDKDKYKDSDNDKYQYS